VRRRHRPLPAARLGARRQLSDVRARVTFTGACAHPGPVPLRNPGQCRCIAP
jgi:hypothetical protein